MHDFCIVDGDRVMPLVLDEDGVVWISGPEFGGVDSVTFDICKPKIEQAGFVISEGRLNERLVARAKEMCYWEVAWVPLNCAFWMTLISAMEAAIYRKCALSSWR